MLEKIEEFLVASAKATPKLASLSRKAIASVEAGGRRLPGIPLVAYLQFRMASGLSLTGAYKPYAQCVGIVAWCERSLDPSKLRRHLKRALADTTIRRDGSASSGRHRKNSYSKVPSRPKR